MKKKLGLSLLAALATVALAATASVQAQVASMTFFVTSVGKSNGADLGGLEGADAHCAALASAAGSTQTNWRAYLSTTMPGGNQRARSHWQRSMAERQGCGRGQERERPALRARQPHQ